jgi:nucleotide-binding universal stress UspA family protein
MYDDILLPVDGSDHATAAAARQALGLAETYGATVHALYVVDTDTSWVTVSKSDVEDSLRDLGESAGTQALASFERLAGAYEVAVVTEMDEGSVDDVILGYADDHGVDLIVMGTHGREGVVRRVVGSVAGRVVRGATVPVMTVIAEGDE